MSILFAKLGRKGNWRLLGRKSHPEFHLSKQRKDINQDSQITEQLYNLDSHRHNARSPVAQAADLHPGEVSEIIEENGRFYLIQCVEKDQRGTKFLAFDGIREQVLKDYIDNKYEEYIGERITNAQIVLNEELYRKFQM